MLWIFLCIILELYLILESKISNSICIRWRFPPLFSLRFTETEARKGFFESKGLHKTNNRKSWICYLPIITKRMYAIEKWMSSFFIWKSHLVTIQHFIQFLPNKILLSLEELEKCIFVSKVTKQNKKNNIWRLVQTLRPLGYKIKNHNSNCTQVLNNINGRLMIFWNIWLWTIKLLIGINLQFLRLKASKTPHLSCVHLIHVDVIMNHQFKLPHAESTKRIGDLIPACI